MNALARDHDIWIAWTEAPPRWEPQWRAMSNKKRKIALKNNENLPKISYDVHQIKNTDFCSFKLVKDIEHI